MKLIDLVLGYQEKYTRVEPIEHRLPVSRPILHNIE